MAEPLTVKEQVMVRLEARLAGLAWSDGSKVFKNVTRHDVPHGTTMNRPHCCVLRGPEKRHPQMQDAEIEGLTLTALIKVYVEDRADVDSRLNQIHGRIYDDIADTDLDGVAMLVRYLGDVPFTAKLLELPSGTEVKSYEIVYAHPRGESTTSFQASA